ncbi:MAG: PspC domain-containing protein [Chitinophagaceae bacterium]|jgi:phage shock protein PspC (stress-responsive transcriptional regulator)|nr:PspC domain-containing protein [Chitinophagaceae bacterium]
MKRVININFQGRIVPIEETAYQILQGYVESLRRFFANEDGRDEIINDIENRIAELFSENLKKGSSCITDDDVNKIIAGMGRPEDFDEDESKLKSGAGNDAGQKNTREPETERPKRRLYRDENNKMLGGVCAGIGNYLRVDPSIVRILFVVITFGGFGAGFLLYFLLWIILPSSTTNTVDFPKRLFRNPDDKVIAGVAGGLAAYFDIAVWIPRLIFVFPLAISIVISIFKNIFWNFEPFPHFLFASFGSTLFLIYVVLWTVLPQANSASEKLEMRGEKVNLNTIKNTIQSDMEEFKNRAEKWGKEFTEKTQQWGENFSGRVKQQSPNMGNKAAEVFGIIVKSFFLFIACIVAFALIMSLIAILLSGANVYPLKDYFIQSGAQTWWLWGTIVFFLLTPVFGLILWLARRVFRVKSKSPSLGFTFSGLWFMGWVFVMLLVASVTRGYKEQIGAEEKVNVAMPSKGKLYIAAMQQDYENYYHSSWYGIDWNTRRSPFYNTTDDSLMLRTIRVNVAKSTDSDYHISVVKFSNGNTAQNAKDYAGKINFSIEQKDSLLTLPEGFAVTKDVKFHNQQVLVIVAVPVGKKIELDESLHDYNWFDINFNFNRRRLGFYRAEWDNDRNNYYYWQSNTEYVMTTDGLKETNQTNAGKENIDDKHNKIKNLEQQIKELQQEQKKQSSNQTDSAVKKEIISARQATAASSGRLLITLASALKAKFCM